MDPRKFVFEEPEERKPFTLLPDGEYPWRIEEINQMETSRAGNPKLPVKFAFTGPGGAVATVYEDLVFTEKAAWKINQFLKSACGGKIDAGREIDFESHDFIKWMAARSGTAVLATETYIDKGGNERQKNVIVAFTYPKSNAGSAAPPAPAPAAIKAEDDDIPF